MKQMESTQRAAAAVHMNVALLNHCLLLTLSATKCSPILINEQYQQSDLLEDQELEKPSGELLQLFHLIDTNASMLLPLLKAS